MDYPFVVPGYEDVPLVLRTGIFSAGEIFHAGVSLEKASRKAFRLNPPGHAPLELTLKMRGLSFSLAVLHGSDVIQVVPPLAWYKQLLTWLPFILVVFGGALAGAYGATAAMLNIAIFRTDIHVAAQVALSLLVTFTAVLGWFLGALVFSLLLAHA